MVKFYKIEVTIFNHLYDKYLACRVFYKHDKDLYIVRTNDEDAQKILSKYGTEIEYVESGINY